MPEPKVRGLREMAVNSKERKTYAATKTRRHEESRVQPERAVVHR